MKAISLKQPWATLVALGAKTIETRAWGTTYRGDVLIVSSKKPATSAELLWAMQILLEVAGIHADSQDFVLGAAVCVVQLADCRSMTTDDERGALCHVTPGRQAWVLKRIRRVKPFDVKGSLGLYEVKHTPGICRACGCTDYAACEGGCRWVEDDMCSGCEFSEVVIQIDDNTTAVDNANVARKQSVEST